MTDQTNESCSASSLEQIKFLQRWYRLELMGVAICGILADAPSMSEHRHKWHALRQLESLMVGKIREALIALGQLPVIEGSVDAEAMTNAQSLMNQRWEVAMARLAEDLRGWLDELARFEDTATEEFRQLARDLSRHEEAWLKFAEIEAQGGDGSDDLVRAIHQM